jgi:hypothetical protein
VGELELWSLFLSLNRLLAFNKLQGVWLVFREFFESLIVSSLWWVRWFKWFIVERLVR